MPPDDKPIEAKTAGGDIPTAVQVKVGLEVPDGTPSYYLNYIEINHSKWDFCLIGAKLPAKYSAAKIAEMQAGGVLALPAEVTINFPSTLIVGLIRALTIQKELYEKETKTELRAEGTEK
jgi:hypothetical protein